jgi:multisubunit Na+/H+ antiporter MnhG subunit
LMLILIFLWVANPVSSHLIASTEILTKRRCYQYERKNMR